MASLECAPSNRAMQEPSVNLRLVLLGKTGSGKSSSGNVILGREAFKAGISPSSITRQSEKQSETVAGWNIAVIDTPGIFDTQLPHQQVMEEVGRCVVLSSPGPHAFLLVLQLGRFTQEEKMALEWIRVTFGPEASKYTMVLFTCGDQLRGKAIEDYLLESKELGELVDSCQGGYHVFDNTKDEKHGTQVTDLLRKVDIMVKRNGGGYYTCEMYQEAEKAIRETSERILSERDDGPDRLLDESSGAEPQVPDGEGRKERGEKERLEEEEEARKRAERLFWCELLTAMGKGAVEGSGVMEKGKGSGKKVKLAQRAAAIASSPLSLTSAAKVVGGAVREGSKVLFKHRKTFLH